MPILYRVPAGLCSNQTGCWRWLPKTSWCHSSFFHYENFEPQLIRVLRAFQLIWSSTNSSNCSIFLEYSSNFEFPILLSSSNCSNLLPLFSASVLVSLTLLSISFNLLADRTIQCIHCILFIVLLILVVTLTALAEISWAKNDLSSSVVFFMLAISE